VAALAAVLSLPVPFLSHKYVVYALIWLVFFLGSFILPTMTGIMIVSVPDYQRTTANSIATLSYNLLGYLPAPFLYGLVSEIRSTGD